MNLPPLSQAASLRVIEKTQKAIREGLGILLEESQRTGMLAAAKCETEQGACLMLAGGNAKAVMAAIVETLNEASHLNCKEACVHAVCSNCGGIREDTSSPICVACAKVLRGIDGEMRN